LTISATSIDVIDKGPLTPRKSAATLAAQADSSVADYDLRRGEEVLDR
jgi:hypothetical protein